ncbi:MAG: EAL domain-containing protein [Gemmatimonadetes bacterium]|nr:EAL domain-containing protein [Gemmatimonadota bacterium]
MAMNFLSGDLGPAARRARNAWVREPGPEAGYPDSEQGAGGTSDGERYFRSLVENASDVILVTSAAGIIRYANPAVERVLGYAPSERVGRSAFEWAHPEDASLLIGAFTRLVQGGCDGTPLEYRVRHRDGSWRVLETTATNLLADTELRGIVINARDVTDRHQAQAARTQLAAVLDATPDLISTVDPHGRILYVNRALGELLGPRLGSDLADLTISDFHPDWALERIRVEGIPTAMREGVWTGELAVLGAGGEEIPVSQVILAHRSRTGAVEFLSTSARDIGESKRAEAALRDSEERFRQVAENIEEVFWLVDREAWRVLYVSPAYEQVWGRSCASLYDDLGTLLRGICEEDRGGLAGSAEEFFLGSHEREYRIVRPDGAVRWIRSRIFPVPDASGNVYRVAGISEDVTSRKQSEAQLIHVALHDSLTGLPNRASFMTRLGKALDRMHQQPHCAFTVLFIDLDRFKLINDSLGHLRGDELLVSISRRLEECVRPEDMVARLAGDEFVVLLHNTVRVADAARVAQRILKRMADPFDLGGHEVFTGASIGIVPSTGYKVAGDLLRDADIAMYRAKVGGRGGYQVFDSAMHAEAVTRLHLETDLRLALQRGEFRLYYQPIVSLATGRISGLEAPVRWEHPEHGLIPPSEFITVAEETGLIVPLGWWVLQRACQQMRSWCWLFPEFRELTVSVNLSGKQFTQRGMVDRIAGILQETEMPAHLLHLEITESVIVEHSEAGSEVFAELKALGLHLHIDDFGTGYSSLSYLHRFPVDTLKIDQSFVGRIDADGEGGEIVRSVAALGQNLRMSVVAEGVETPAQLEELRALGCDYAQGYLLSRPLDVAGTEALVRSSPRW